jgi:hypothetical protein
MQRGVCALLAVFVPSVFCACNDEIISEVPKDVCVTEKQWVGGRHGDPRMFPGRDCVGCHLENDGPQLVLGGTIYPYLVRDADQLATLQTGEDCFGVAGVKVHIEGADGQSYDLTTNEAGNFYVEGDPRNLVKPFTAKLDYISANGKPSSPSMTSPAPSYGGCAHCHTPGQKPFLTEANGDAVRDDLKVYIATHIGEPEVDASKLAAEVGVPLPSP